MIIICFASINTSNNNNKKKSDTEVLEDLKFGKVSYHELVILGGNKFPKGIQRCDVNPKVYRI